MVTSFLLRRAYRVISLFSVEVREMESLESKWQQLQLTSEEDKELILDENKLLKEIEKEKHSIIGKLLMDRSINKEVISLRM